jgi:alanine-synthesizing transaminase
MFSSRTNWNISPNRLSVLLEQKHQQGIHIIDLTESNPTCCGFSYPRREILEAFSHPSIFTYQPEPQGLLSAREAIAQQYSKIGVPVEPRHILLTASTSEAYSFLLKLLCNAGDEIIVPQPSYPLFEYLCQLNDVTLRTYRLAYDGEWHIDFTSFESQLTNRTRAVVLVHPNNPTGSYLKQKEFERICSLATLYHCSLIADEVFGPYAFSPDTHRAQILNSQSQILLFSLNGISKLLGLPQFKLSWIVVQGNSSLTDDALKKLEIIEDTFLSVNTPVQLALPKLLQYSSDMRNQIQSRTRDHYALLQETFTDSSATVFYSEGGWYALLQLPHRSSDEEWAEQILLHQNILVQPGHFFDLEQESCIVISLLPVSNIFRDALQHIRQFIEKP